jgi:hypothetical protein
MRGVRQIIAAVAIDTAKGRILDEGPEAHDDGEAFEKAKHGPMSAQGNAGRIAGATLMVAGITLISKF